MSDMLCALPWQQAQWQHLTQLAVSGKMPHAWLLIGPSGVGKRQFATAFTAFMLCESRQASACGTCRSCQQFLVGHHPNALHLKRLMNEKTNKLNRDINIEQIRELNERLSLSSHYGQAKIAVIDPADALNQNSINALLKTIEEPPSGSYLLLLSERPMALAATLRSRCQQLRFAVPTEAESLQWLGAGKAAERALQQSHGAPLKARERMDAGKLDRINEWGDVVTAIAARKREPIQFAATLTSSKASAKEDAAEFLMWLLSWLTAELRAALRSHGSYSPVVLEIMLRDTLEAQRRLAGNGLPQLILEALLVNWWHLARQSRAA
jgi:DNA polymerase-3 subunit delta'